MTISDFEFVNRDEELAFLKSQIGQGALPALIVLRSPSGFGKSSLTDYLARQPDLSEKIFCIVDPEIGAEANGIRLHDGFMIQRCAEQLSALARDGAVSWPTFDDFLKSRKLQTVKEKKASDFISEMPSLKSAYAILLDYASRAFSFGRFSAQKLLSSDSNDAVKICTSYFEFSIRSNNIVVIIRDAQKCDILSLRTFLSLNEHPQCPHFILEYTSKSQYLALDPSHHKIIDRTKWAKQRLIIQDLIPLNYDHLNYIVKKATASNFIVTRDSYDSWDGNLRSIVEMRYQHGVGKRIETPAQIGGFLEDLTGSLHGHLSSLSSLEKMVVAVCSAHIEAINEGLILSTMASISPSVSPNVIKQALYNLTRSHNFLTERDANYSVQNGTIVQSIGRLPQFQSLTALAEKTLRDRYKQMVSVSSSNGVAFGAAVRQVFRLCARTKDVVGLRQIIDLLSQEIRRAHDQSIYVEMLATAITADPVLYANDHGDLVSWAASLAYDIGAWEQTDALITILPDPDMVCLAMRAFALQEIGRHQQALEIAGILRAKTPDSDGRLAADLIEAIIVGCKGDGQAARRQLNALLNDPAHTHSALLGYAYRFFEVVEEYSGCIDHLHQSIAHFEKFGLTKSKAYSQAATAVLIARHGEIAPARKMITEAAQVLAADVQDRHLVLNNMAAIDLLSESPDFTTCRDLLTEGLRYVRDDYCEVTVLSNLSIAYWGGGELEMAQDCVSRILSILEDHDFADTEIYWPLCFNASKILSGVGRIQEGQDTMRIPLRSGRPPSANRKYWDYRYGDSFTIEPAYRYLASRPYHPLYLSHWLVDLDGLNLLKRALPQLPMHTPIPSR